MINTEEKYLKITWNQMTIEKIEPCESVLANFKIERIIPNIKNVIDLLSDVLPNYIFEYKNNRFLTAGLKGSLDPLSINVIETQNYIKIISDVLHVEYQLETDTSYENLMVIKDVLKMFDLKYKQRFIKQNLKKQLSYMGYEPNKIRRVNITSINDEYFLCLRVGTKYGVLNITVDKNGCNLENVNYDDFVCDDIEKIDSQITRLKSKLEMMEKFKNVYYDIHSEIGNCAIVFK